LEKDSIINFFSAREEKGRQLIEMEFCNFGAIKKEKNDMDQFVYNSCFL
jgi:hypothetical protein